MTFLKLDILPYSIARDHVYNRLLDTQHLNGVWTRQAMHSTSLSPLVTQNIRSQNHANIDVQTRSGINSGKSAVDVWKNLP